MGTVTKDDLQRFMTKLGNRGGKDYLTVPGRVWWFRQDHPQWGIVTTPHEISVEQGYAIFTTSIFNDDGRVIATATASETARDFADFIEKAGTKSVGRALILAGYGIENAGDELHEGTRYADAPQPAAILAPLPPVQEQSKQFRESPELVRAMKAFGGVARELGFPVDNEAGTPSKSRFVDLMVQVATADGWAMPAGWADMPDVWQRGATLLPKFAAARKEAK